MSTHESTHTSASHLNKFYVTFPEIRKKHFDGMIITGAPVELMEVEGGQLLAGADADHGVEQDACDLHDASLLGRAGGLILSLRNPEAPDEKKLPVSLPRRRWTSGFRS